MKYDVVRPADVNGNAFHLRPGDVLDDKTHPAWLIAHALEFGYAVKRTRRKPRKTKAQEADNG